MTEIRESLKNLEFRVKPNLLSATLARAVTDDPWQKYLTSSYNPDALFVHIPKTAGTSILRLFGFRTGHVPVTRYYSWDHERARRAYKFTFVRNPWLRTRSGYFFLRSEYGKLEAIQSPDANQKYRKNWIKRHVLKADTFEDFVLSLREESTRRAVLRFYIFRPQIDWIRPPGSKNHLMDFVGRTEHLGSDVERLRSIFGLNGALEHHRATPNQPAQFNSEMVGIIGDLYEEDILEFQYSESGVYDTTPRS